jgi:DNA-binding NarL/FixJ family response regulator
MGEGEGEMKLGPRPTGPLWTPAEDEQLLALLDSGMDKKLIARRLKRTVQAVLTRKYVLNKRRLVERGLKARKQ